MQHRSAPGTPLNSCHHHLRHHQRAPSTEERAGPFLHVPFSRMRGKSLPEDMENTLDKNSIYLLRQFNIKGRKVNLMTKFFQLDKISRGAIMQVVHLGDSYRHRSNNSLASCPSQGFIHRHLIVWNKRLFFVTFP